MRVMFLYLGRRGALGQFTLELAEVVSRMEGVEAEFAISSSNKLGPRIARLNMPVLSLDTFEKATPLSVLGNFYPARRRLIQQLERTRPAAVVTLMPHVWTPVLAPSITRLGLHWAPLVRGAVPHPGGATVALTKRLRRYAHVADLVITLSRTVADRLLTIEHIPPERILPLFHPNLQFGSALAHRVRDPKRPLKVLFFGRIMKYKGLPQLIEALELLAAEGVHVHLGVAGEGNIAKEAPRLAALGAEIINRWVEEDEVGPLLARYDALVLSHIEASQSGVAATAHGNCMPVVGMPVGGISEQIIDARTGVLAHRVCARSLADAVKRLAVEAGLYEAISSHLSETQENRSMERFAGEIVAEVARLHAPKAEGRRCRVVPLVPAGPDGWRAEAAADAMVAKSSGAAPRRVL
jgi:glycosyltransferase involved in cell wall biosynthesis